MNSHQANRKTCPFASVRGAKHRTRDREVWGKSPQPSCLLSDNPSMYLGALEFANNVDNAFASCTPASALLETRLSLKHLVACLRSLTESDESVREEIEAIYRKLSTDFSEFRHKQFVMSSDAHPRVKRLKLDTSESQKLSNDLILQSMPNVSQFPCLSRATLQISLDSPALLGVITIDFVQFESLCSYIKPQWLNSICVLGVLFSILSQ